jgi:hypothetical protein
VFQLKRYVGLWRPLEHFMLLFARVYAFSKPTIKNTEIIFVVAVHDQVFHQDPEFGTILYSVPIFQSVAPA